MFHLSSWSRSPYPLWGGLSWGRTARQYVSFCNLSRSNAICELSGVDGTEQRDRVQRLRPPHPLVCACLSRRDFHRSEEHRSELQSLMRISYAVFCLNTKRTTNKIDNDTINNNIN